MSTDKLPTGWTRVKFGDVVQNVTERVMPSPDESRLYVGLEHMQSESLRLTGVGSEVDLVGEKLRMRAGDVLFARRNPHLRRVAVAPHDGPFSAHGMVLRSSDVALLLQGFLPYFLQSEQFMARANQVAVGSLSRTINWKDLKGEEFALPPIGEQKRIVEQLACFNRLEISYRSTLDAVALRREAEIGLLSGSSPEGLVPLGDAARVTSGESWSGSDERLEPAPGAVAVVGISSLKPGGAIEYEHPTYVLGLGSKTGLVTVDEKCVIVIRTNGNPDRIGNVYLATPAVDGCAVSAFTFCCSFESREQAELAFEYMSGRAFQRWTTSLVAGSTGLKNLPVNQLRRALVPSIKAPGSAESYERLRALRDLAESATAARKRAADLARATRETLMRGGVHVR